MTITYDLVFVYGAPYIKFTITNHAADRYNLFLIGNLYINGVKVPNDPDYRCIAETATSGSPVEKLVPISTGGSCILDPLVNSLEFRPLIKDGWPASGKVWISWETSNTHLTPCGPNGCPPSGQSAYLGESITVPIHKVEASSNNPCTGGSIQLIGSPSGLLTYEWKNQDGVVVGTTKDVTIPNANPSQSGTYTLKGCTDISGSCSGTATTVVTVKPTIVLTGPQSKTVCIGDTALFSVTASPTNSYIYQWQENSGSGWSNIQEATSSSYTVTGTSANSGYQYRVLVSYDDQDSCQVESNPATLTLRTPITLSGPASQTVCDAGAATFSVTASPTGTYNYQWQEDSGSGWLNILGATSSIYTVIGTSANNGHQFRVLVSYDDQGSCQVESNAALLTVRPPITLSTPTSQIVCDGGAAIFSVTASPTGTYNYQWQEDSGSGWLNIQGATSSSYIVIGTFANNGHKFRVLVSYDDQGSCQVESNAALLTVRPPITLSTPASQIVCDGDAATFFVTASPTGTYNYQWQEDSGSVWSNIQGATSSSYAVIGTSANNGHQFRVLVSYDDQGSCQVESNAALLTVRPPITLGGLSSQTVCDGSTATFFVTASPSGTYNYQWQENSGSVWSNIPGATSPSYTVTGTSANNGHQFKVMVSYSNPPSCQYESIVATLIVQAKATASAGPPQTICSDEIVALDGHASNYQTVTWSGGAGNFNPNAQALDALYTPTAAEVASGSVTLTLTATAVAPCSDSAISQMTITIEPRPNAKILVIEPVSVI